ncbi:hypothetical protein GCWU000341_01370 [Oribacterium sp. oral taxon 078 str. F0262]|nr:hypothetical protein GCWU000341_01370 [Oribacterium sp. oral taxon 078 str. F0262]
MIWQKTEPLQSRLTVPPFFPYNQSRYALSAPWKSLHSALPFKLLR